METPENGWLEDDVSYLGCLFCQVLLLVENLGLMDDLAMSYHPVFWVVGFGRKDLERWGRQPVDLRHLRIGYHAEWFVISF